MGYKKWVVKETDRQLAKDLALECDVEPIVALISLARGYDNPADLEQFLSDEPCFSDAYGGSAELWHPCPAGIPLQQQGGKLCQCI